MHDLSSSLLQIESQVSHDLDRHAAAQQGWTLHYDQLGEGRFEGHMLKVQLIDVTLLREACSVRLRQRGRLQDNVYGFSTGLEDTPDLHFNGQPVPANAIMCGKGDEVDMITPPHFTLLAMVVPKQLLGPLWESMYHKPLAHWLEHKLVLQSTREKMRTLRMLHVGALAQLQQQDTPQWTPAALMRLRDDLLIEWLEALPPSVDASARLKLERRRKLVDQACELMLGRPDEPPSILDLCSQLGTSRRLLNYSFQEVLGTNPVKYLRIIRLNGVRRALLHAHEGETVQNVAAHWGFWHLSQFAQDYRRQFGELPSHTLRSRAGAAS